MEKGSLKKNIAGFFGALFFFILIASILVHPGIAFDITMNPGSLSLDDISAYEGTEINFDSVSYTVEWDNKNSVEKLNFSIFNSENDKCVAFVNFDINANKIQDESLGEFNVTKKAVEGGEKTIHPAHGYSPKTVSYSDLTYSYNISYTAYKVGTFYAKLFVYSTSKTHTSSKSTEFTIKPPEDGSLFDVELDVILDTVYTGENNSAIIDLTNVGEIGLVNASLTRTIYFENKTIWTVEEDISISGHTSFNATIPTEYFEPGVYTYEVVHRYGNNQTASATDTFVVMSKIPTTPPSEKTLNIGLPIWIVIIVSIIISIILIIFLLFKFGYIYIEEKPLANYIVIFKESKQTKTEKLKKELNDKNNILQKVNYIKPTKGVYLFEKKIHAYKLAETLQKNKAKYFIERIEIIDEDDLEEGFSKK